MQRLAIAKAAPIFSRAFSTAAAPHEEEEEEEKISNAFKNQHIRYVPNKKYNFNRQTPEGRMALVFESSNSLVSKKNTWQVVFGSAIPGAALALHTLPAAYLTFALPMLFLPTAYSALQSFKINKLFKDEVKRMWVLKNGDQLIVETFDGMLHKLNIMDNREHEITESKDKSLIFVMVNSGREFYISAKNAEKIDYDLIDRVIRAICVNTKHSQQVFHHLISKQ